MLVAWERHNGGNFDGSQIWKHRLGHIYYRMGNAAGVANPVGYEDLWALTCNSPPGGHGPNIRNIELYSGLDIMDTPSIAHALDEDLIDRFKVLYHSRDRRPVMDEDKNATAPEMVRLRHPAHGRRSGSRGDAESLRRC